MDEKFGLKELRQKRALLNKAVDFIRDKNDHNYQSYYSGKLVELATKLYIAYLFVKYAPFSEEKKKTTGIFFEKEMPVLERLYKEVTSGNSRVIEEYAELLKAEG